MRPNPRRYAWRVKIVDRALEQVRAYRKAYLLSQTVGMSTNPKDLPRGFKRELNRLDRLVKDLSEVKRHLKRVQLYKGYLR